MARYAAPVAFLVAVTIGLLLVRAGLNDDEPAGRRATTSRTTTATTSARTSRTSTGAGLSYTIQAGDTLGSVASRFDTSVERILELNAGLEPTGLQVGQRIRVK